MFPRLLLPRFLNAIAATEDADPIFGRMLVRPGLLALPIEIAATDPVATILAGVVQAILRSASSPGNQDRAAEFYSPVN